jgi:hypothetical protein
MGRGNLAYSVDSKRDTITLKTSSGMAAWWKTRSNGFMSESFTTSTNWPTMFNRRVHGVSLPCEDMCGVKDRMSKKWKIEYVDERGTHSYLDSFKLIYWRRPVGHARAIGGAAMSDSGGA